MQYKYLGNTGVKVSSLCMGTMTFGQAADQKTSPAIFHRCQKVGINFFDCANGYASGRSEEILGSLIAVTKLLSRVNSGFPLGKMSMPGLTVISISAGC